MINIFHQRRIVLNEPPLPNLYIEDGSSFVPNKATLASKISRPESDILTFEIIGNNVVVYVKTNFGFNNSSFRNSSVTGVYNTDGKMVNMGAGTNSFAFFANSVISGFNGHGVKQVGRQSTQSAKFTLWYLPSLTIAQARSFGAFGSVPFDRIYLPSITTTTVCFDANSGQYTGTVAYVNPFLSTNNGGGVDSQIQSYINKGGIVVWLTDTVNIPGDITDLSSSSITSSSVTLSFTPPSSVNPLDFYEVWIDDGTDNPRHLFSHHREISGSGSLVSGLSSNTTYTIKVASCDTFWNGSGYADYRSESSWSNEITITTL